MAGRIAAGRRPHDTMARVVRELMLGGHANATALSKIIFGATNFRGGIISAIEKLREHGVVRVHSYGADGFARYAMQKIPGHLPDAPAPAYARSDRHHVPGRAPKRFIIDGKLMTASEIAATKGLHIQEVRKRFRGQEAGAA